ncbi:MAG: hypothetical protein QOI67_155 [Gaiellaceae bacterium]|jgi:hypothetical protein|nr:hypothetical protein [Gaiellaceae bacterium]
MLPRAPSEYLFLGLTQLALQQTKAGTAIGGQVRPSLEQVGLHVLTYKT